MLIPVIVQQHQEAHVVCVHVRVCTRDFTLVEPLWCLFRIHLHYKTQVPKWRTGIPVLVTIAWLLQALLCL